MKKTLCTFLSVTLLLLTLLTSCQNETNENKDSDNSQVNTKQATPEKMIETLAGEWKIDRIMKGNQNVTDAEGGANQTMIFTNEARYVRQSGNQKSDSGAYRMNEQLRNLYLESGINEQPQEWEVTFDSGAMILTRREGSSARDNLKYIYRRSSPSPD